MRDEQGQKQFNCLDGSNDVTKFLNELLRKLFTQKDIGEGVICPKDPNETESEEDDEEKDDNARKSQRNILDKVRVESYLKSKIFCIISA